MDGQLTINGKDAYTHYGVFLTEKSLKDYDNLSELLRPSKMKPYTAVTYREEDGERLPRQLPAPAFEARDFTLYVALLGESPQDFAAKYEAWIALLKSGWLTLQVAGIARSFRVYYKECSQFDPLTRVDEGRVVCRMALKFREPQPSF